jgi:hypothetical protein
MYLIVVCSHLSVLERVLEISPGRRLIVLVD